MDQEILAVLFWLIAVGVFIIASWSAVGLLSFVVFVAKSLFHWFVSLIAIALFVVCLGIAAVTGLYALAFCPFF